MDDAGIRRGRAARAALAVAKRLGIETDGARVIKDSNNTIVHLLATSVVAKVGTSTLRPDIRAVLERELDIGLHLAERAAPIAPPVSHVSPGPHLERGTVITLWQYTPSADSPVSTEQLGQMLTSFHRAFADYPEPLPDFTANLERARMGLEHTKLTSALSPSDRAFLLDMAADLEETLKNADIPRHPLHGDPHEDGNILPSNNGPLLIDFEAACVGPYEWDLTSLERAVDAYPLANRNLVMLLSRMRSVVVSASCWMQYGRAPEVDEAAHVHLNFLREKASDW
ncbi:MAG: phosphotransferase enzyme family protein [Actinomycetota bacterium]